MNITNKHSSSKVAKHEQIRQQFLPAVFNSNIIPVGIIGENMKFTNVNEAFCQLLDIEKSRLLRMAVWDLGFKENEDIRQGLRRIVTMESDVLELNKVMSAASDEKERFLNIKIVGLFDTNQFVGGVVMAGDISEKMYAEKQLRSLGHELEVKERQLKKYIDSNLQLENFAYIASHDLKEPLRTIGNFVQLLEKRFDDILDTNSKEYIKFIVDGVQNMNLLINDLLAYSRVNTQDHTLEPIGVDDTLFIIIRSLDKTVEEQEAKIIVEEIPETIIGNKTKIKQLFQNLIANAIKFRKPEVPPVVRVKGEDIGTHWKFSISDNGIGIKEEFHEKIFLLFKKLHTKQEYQGTGIGLAICKKIVEQHGGEIWVDSVPGEGATFYFTLNKNPEEQ